MNNSLNCNICHKSYSRKHDLKMHQEKEPSTSISELTPMDWVIPQTFYDLRDTLENDGLQMNNSSQSLNKSTQTTEGKINLAPPTRYVNTNTEPKVSVDKSTNTEPFIILEPSGIDKLSSGFKLLTFGTIPQIYLQLQIPRSLLNQRL